MNHQIPAYHLWQKAGAVNQTNQHTQDPGTIRHPSPSPQTDNLRFPKMSPPHSHFSSSSQQQVTHVQVSQQITVYSTFRTPSFIPPSKGSSCIHSVGVLQGSFLPGWQLHCAVPTREAAGGTDCGVAVCAEGAACGQ